MQLFGFAGFSGAGKTTLLEGVTKCLVGLGLRVSLIKHAHHAFDIDHPGKDSWRHRQAGCSEVLLASTHRVALMRELRGDPEPSLGELIDMLAPCDFVLVEGYKYAEIPKIEVRRQACPAPLLHTVDPWIVAVATDEATATELPVFGLDEHRRIAAFICGHDTISGRSSRTNCTDGTSAARIG